MMSKPLTQQSAKPASANAGPELWRSGCAAANPASGASASAVPTPRWQSGVKRFKYG
jgi:hypothetical protein